MTSEVPAAGDITSLLIRWSSGDEAALDTLMPFVYAECRAIAARQMRGEREDHTLSPTALVNEMYLRLIDQRRTTWKDRAHFFGIAAKLMRRVLVDYARAQLAAKRGGGSVTLALGAAEDGAAQPQTADDVVALNEALDRLAAIDADQERIVELRYFAGLTVEETAHLLGRSPRTIKRHWQLAKAWLYRELHGASTATPDV